MDNQLGQETVAGVFARWDRICQVYPERFGGIDARYKWVISGVGGGAWLFVCNNRPNIVENFNGKADCQIEISEDDFLLLASGKLNAQSAFLSGRLQIYGELSLILRLNLVLDILID